MTYRPLNVCLLVALLLSGCESDRLPQGTADAGSGLGAGGLSDDSPVTDPAFLRSLVTVTAERVSGVSRDGDEADMHLEFAYADELDAMLTRNTQLHISREVPGEASQLLMRIAVNGEMRSGSADLSVPTFDPSAYLRLELVGLKGELHSGMANYAVVEPPSHLSVPCTNLEYVSDIDVELVSDSYTSEIVGNRREHRFSVRVNGQYQAPEQSQASTVSVSCLDREADRHFFAREYGRVDPESAVVVDYEQKTTAVYFVIDGSSSIVMSESADVMIDALSRSVIALSDVSDFDYRLFGSEVYHVDSLRESMRFDTPLSGSALYYAIDTALNDIEATASPGRDAVVVVFSDGADLASRNQYPAFLSHEQVRRHLTARIRTVRSAMADLYNRRLDTFFVYTGGGLPEDQQSFFQVATDSGTKWTEMPAVVGADGARDSAIAELFDGLANDIRGVYHLLYSSQQTPDDTELRLEVRLDNDADVKAVSDLLPNAYRE